MKITKVLLCCGSASKTLSIILSPSISSRSNLVLVQDMTYIARFIPYVACMTIVAYWSKSYIFLLSAEPGVSTNSTVYPSFSKISTWGATVCEVRLSPTLKIS